MTDVGKPNVGEFKPSRVNADVLFSLANVRNIAKVEWDSLRPHDSVFLVTIEARYGPGEAPEPGTPSNLVYGIKYVRGAEVHHLLDEDGQLVKEDTDRTRIPGTQRTLRLWLDTAQYQLDVDAGKENVYKTFNVLVRRKPKENNFKAVLETIRDLMANRATVPDWLRDLFLGFGDPASAHYSRLKSRNQVIDFRDTFLNADHLRNAFSDKVSIRLP